MQAGDVKLGSIFADNHRYVIPMFQRPYVWTAERNWRPLWTDIASAADGVLADVERGDWPDEPPTYFLGAIVIKATPRHPQRLAGSILVDGQQRLTTLQVLLAAARHVAYEVGADSTAGRFDDWISNSAKAVHENWSEDRFKLWPLPQDREYYLWAVRDPGDESPNPDSNHPITVARTWFEAEIRSWAMRGADPAGRLDALHSALVERMELVRITLEKTDNAQIIFEALNHRGVELSQSDLIKNLLFRIVEDQGAGKQAESLLLDYWLPLDGKEWRAETVTGRIRRSLLDQVVAYWLTVRKGEVVSVERLFDEFKAWLVEGNHDAAEVIKEVRRYADLYRNLTDNPPGRHTASLVDMLLATRTTTAWPLLLAIQGDGRVNAIQREKAAQAIYSYLMRRMLCNLTLQDANRMFATVLSTAQARADEDGLAGEAIEERLALAAAESRYWPDDAEFHAAIIDTNFFGHLRPRQRAFFAGIENHLRDDRAEENSRISARWEHLNIEHLLPQSWQENWPLPNPDDEKSLEERSRAVNSVGNLTLTNGRLNSQLKNSAWSTKRHEIGQKSTLLITTASVLAAPPNAVEHAPQWADSWDETRILVRGRYLADLALQVWPRPTILPTTEPDEPDEPEEFDELDE